MWSAMSNDDPYSEGIHDSSPIPTQESHGFLAATRKAPLFPADCTRYGPSVHGITHHLRPLLRGRVTWVG